MTKKLQKNTFHSFDDKNRKRKKRLINSESFAGEKLEKDKHKNVTSRTRNGKIRKKKETLVTCLVEPVVSLDSVNGKSFITFINKTW